LTLLMTLIFALAISVDSFLVGVSYGIKNITLPKRSILIVTAFSGGMLLLFMLAGDFFASFLEPRLIVFIAAGLLAALGIYKLVEAWLEQKADDSEWQIKKTEKLARQAQNPLMLHLRIPFMPYAIQILHEPERAAKVCHEQSVDKIGKIDRVEKSDAWALGMAMAFDAIGGGFAASLAGLPIILTVVMALFVMGTLLVAALIIGRRFRLSLLREKGRKKRYLEKGFNFLPGILMICLALWKMFF
jgi:putative sporulation protein YtaF